MLTLEFGSTLKEVRDEKYGQCRISSVMGLGIPIHIRVVTLPISYQGIDYWQQNVEYMQGVKEQYTELKTYLL